MSRNEILALVYVNCYFFIRLLLIIKKYIDNEFRPIGSTLYRIGRHNSAVVSFENVFTINLLLNLLCLFFVLYAFMPNWLTFLISRNKKIEKSTEEIIFTKIKIFNSIYHNLDLNELERISTKLFFNSENTRYLYWKSMNMKRVVKVLNYRRIRVLENDEVNKQITIICFEKRHDYLTFRGRPLRNEDTSYSWDYLFYQFKFENNEWRLNYYEKDPSDMKLYSYL